LIKHGANEEEASTVAQYLTTANLAGHDSHGILQLLGYVDRIKMGHIVPGAKFEIENETPTTAVINGNWGFGMVVQTKATRLAIEKAKKSNVAAVTVAFQSHVGLLGTYTLMAASEGMIGMMFCDSGEARSRWCRLAGETLGSVPILSVSRCRVTLTRLSISMPPQAKSLRERLRCTGAVKSRCPWLVGGQRG